MIRDADEHIEALILAGGFDTDSAAASSGASKLLAQIGESTFLDYQIDWLARQGVGKATLAIGASSEKFDSYAKGGAARPLSVAIIREAQPLGTGGAVANALRSMESHGDILVVNGDTLFQFDIAGALAQHRQRRAAVTMIVGWVDDVKHYGTVVVSNGKVLGFTQGAGEKRPGFVNSGAYIVSSDAFDNKWTGAFSLEADFFANLILSRRLDAHIINANESFSDIGEPNAYDDFIRKLNEAGKEYVRQLIIPETADLRDVMQCLKASGRGIAIVVDGADRARGVLTDGDVRRALLNKEDLHQRAVDHMTRNFVYVLEGAPKEQTLKLLDSRIHAIPVLDGVGRVVGVVSPGYLETRPATYARAKAPVRVSLAGGGTDFTSYFMEHGGVSLSTTIALHAHAVLRKREDMSVHIYSHDRDQIVDLRNVGEISYDGKLDLIKAAVKVMNPNYGFDLWVSCDFPEASGMGGSAALVAAVLGCLNEFRQDKLDVHALAEYAFEAERIELSIKGGWQDQYSTVFGGFNFIEFDKMQNSVTPLRLMPDTMRELEERFLLCFTGKSHLGSVIQADNHTRDISSKDSLAFTTTLKNIAIEMRSHLLRGNIAEFGRLLDETWSLKKSFDRRVTNEDLNAIYDLAMRSGAVGGRLLGTGGGGYFLFLSKPFERYRLAKALEERGLKAQSIVFDDKGLQSWTARP